MDDLPELADDGHNWTAYGSWVLNAIADEGLIGFLLGSETRPMHPAQLKGRGEGWTPQTNKERDEVAAWQTSDEFWHKQSSKVNLLLIFGISDSRSTMAQLRDQKAVLHEAEATSQQTSGSLLGQSATHDNKKDSTELSLETTAEVEHALNGHSELELEGVPCEAGSGSMDELGDANPKMSSGRTDETSTTGTRSQLVIANVTRDLHLLKPGSETFDLAINSTNLENTYAIKTTSQMPDPPCIHVAAPNPFIGQSDQVFGTHPHEAQMALSDQAALTNEPKCLKDLQEAERPHPERDRAPAVRQETCKGQCTWNVSIDETGGLGKHGGGTSHWEDSRDGGRASTKQM